MKLSSNIKSGRVTSDAEATPIGDTWFTAKKPTPFGDVEFSFVEHTDVAVYLDQTLIASTSRPSALRFPRVLNTYRRLRQLRRLVREQADELVLAYAIEQIAEDVAHALAGEPA